MTIHGRITISDNPEDYGDEPRIPEEQVLAIAEQLRTRLRSYIDTEYPGNAIEIHRESGRDYIWDDGEERHDILDEIGRESERIFNEIGHSTIPD